MRENLCKKLDYPIELLWIVDKENGNIYKDDSTIKASKTTYTLMLGNKTRANGSNDKKSNRSAVIKEMDCFHLPGNFGNFLI